MPETLADHFEHLAHQLRQLIALLEESQDHFWIGALSRGLKQIDELPQVGAVHIPLWV